MLIERSQSLKEYSQFIYRLQQGKLAGKSLEEALSDAMQDCIEQDIMRGFLENHGSEVRNMLYTEWNVEDACRVAREEAMEIGMEKGIEKGIAETNRAHILAIRDIVAPEVIAEKFGLPLDEVLHILKAPSIPTATEN